MNLQERVKATRTNAGMDGTPMMQPHISMRQDILELQREASQLFSQQAQPQPMKVPALEVGDIDTAALKRDIDQGSIRDFFNVSYSQTEVAQTFRESDAKFQHPHEWRVDAQARREYDSNRFNDFEFRKIEDSAARSMTLTHKAEMSTVMPSRRSQLLAQHQTEKSLFECHATRSTGNTRDTQQRHAALLDDYAQFKTIKTGQRIDEKPDASLEFSKVQSLDHKPAVKVKMSMAQRYAR